MGFYKTDGYRLNAKFASKDSYSTPPATYQFGNGWMIDNGWRSCNIDPFSSKQNHKTKIFLTKRDDQNAYVTDWQQTVGMAPARAWVNPPFSKGGLLRSTTRIVQMGRLGVATLALLPVWVGDWWSVENVKPYASEILFVEGRIKFIGMAGKPNFTPHFSSMFVLWEPGLRPPGQAIRTSWVKCPLE